jgi:hypothetical protein
LNLLEVPFLIGGSVASGTHGIPRLTKDIDIVADLRRDRVGEYCDALQPVFYVDPELVEHAIEMGRSFNLIHIKGAYKVDMFPVGTDSFARSEMERRLYTASVIPGLQNVDFPIASPEDTILSDLVRFRKGNEVSDLQWHAVLGVIRVQGEHLDQTYLQEWAARLGVSDLLVKAFSVAR